MSSSTKSREAGVFANVWVILRVSGERAEISKPNQVSPDSDLGGVVGSSLTRA